MVMLLIGIGATAEGRDIVASNLPFVPLRTAWSYRPRPGVGPALGKATAGGCEEIKEMAWKSPRSILGTRTNP